MGESRSEAKSEQTLSESARGIVSLVIFLHLFCVFIGLFGNESSADLMSRIRRLLGPYIRAVNLDSQYPTGFHLTHGMEYEDDHQIAVRGGEEGDVQIYPRPSVSILGERLGFENQRWRRLSQEFGRFADRENDQALAELSRAIGSQVLASSDSQQIQVESRRIWPRELEPDVPSPEPQTLYTADVLRDINGVVKVHKRVVADEAAPTRVSQ